MRTSALRVTAGLYPDGEWHVTLIEDSYLRGVLINSELLIGPMRCPWDDVEDQVLAMLRRLKERELSRITLAATG